MKKEHPVQELTRNYFNEFKNKIFNAFCPDISDLGRQFDPYSEESFEEGEKTAMQILFDVARSYHERLQQLTIEEQRDFISRIRRECLIDEYPETLDFVENTGLANDVFYGNLFRTHGLTYIYNYREIARNLSVIAPKNVTAVQTEVPTSNVRLVWTGKANVLYHFFGQCLNPPSGKPYIANTAEDIADFILKNFQGIGANKKTIATEILRYKNNDKSDPRNGIRIEEKDT